MLCLCWNWTLVRRLMVSDGHTTSSWTRSNVALDSWSANINGKCRSSSSADHWKCTLVKFSCGDELLIIRACTSSLSVRRLHAANASSNSVCDVRYVCSEYAAHWGCTIRRICTCNNIMMRSSSSSNHSIESAGSRRDIVWMACAVPSFSSSAEGISLDHDYIRVFFVSLL